MATILPLALITTTPPKTGAREGGDDALDSLAALLANDLIAVNRFIIERAKSPVPLIPRLADHIIAAGGKRLRPLLALAATRLCGYQGERPIKLAAAIEFIHTATLLHDDVVDASAMRRGRPSANALFGNQASVLIGDFLLSRAFQLMVEDGSLDVLGILSNVSAVIAEGEVLQLAAQNDGAINEQTYLDIVRAKTAELFAASCRVGAVIAGSDAAREDALSAFGLNLGIAFQIVDDVLDYAADSVRLGKAVGDDFREGKVTLPVILAIARAGEADRAFFKKTFEQRRQKDGDFAHALDILRRTNALSACIERARHYGAIARDSLGLFEDSRIKRVLLDIVDFTIDRRF